MEDKFKSVGDILRDILPKEVFETPTIPQQIEMIFAPNAEATWKDEDEEFDVLTEWFGYDDNGNDYWR